MGNLKLILVVIAIILGVVGIFIPNVKIIGAGLICLAASLLIGMG